jgi:hypothetical protein
MKKQRYTWGESFHGFYFIDNKTGNTAECGDGVDMFQTEKGSIAAGSKAFYAAMNKMVKNSQEEISEAYFSRF